GPPRRGRAARARPPGGRGSLGLPPAPRLHRPGALGVWHEVRVTGVLPVDDRQRTPAEDLAPRLADAGTLLRAARGLELRVLAARERLDLLRDAHAAPVVAAHRAEVGVDVEVLVVEGPRRLAVKRELELPGPVERGAGAREVVVPGAGGGDAAGDVAGVGGDLVRDAPGFHVVRLRQPDVLLRGHVAEHRGAGARRLGRADRARDVVVAREGVGHERAEDVERGVVTDLLLELHVPRDLVERDVARPLDHRLHARRPGALDELPERAQLGELRRVARVGEAAGAEPVAERVGHVVLAHD